jgi:imidazole glycerol-phosphate synthase subunit HisH
MRVAIIDYGSGNLRSATKAFERAAREAGISAEIDLTADADRVRSADRIVLPGVGAYADCAAGLRAVDGMWEAVQEVAIISGRPFLGICVGMQLMSDRGLEKTVTDGFGWIAGDVKQIEPADPALKDPADRLERDSRETFSSAARRHTDRRCGIACLFRAFLPT